MTSPPDYEMVANTANLLRPPHRLARSTPVPDPARLALQAEWLHLTRVELPEVAVARGWPIHMDHCFQRVLLDTACHGCWYDRIAGRPAYAYAPDAILVQAIALGRAAIDDRSDMAQLNLQSLAWRGKT